MRRVSASRCPAWLGVAALVVAGIIIASAFAFPGDQLARWPAWVAAGIFLLAGIQILRVTMFGASPHGRASAILAAVIYAAFAAVFAFVASELFSDSTRIRTRHPVLAKIHIILMLGIVGFLFARFVYRALFPPDDNAA